jgi:hypothetical protein
MISADSLVVHALARPIEWLRLELGQWVLGLLDGRMPRSDVKRILQGGARYP